jgi:hypothetical protein
MLCRLWGIDLSVRSGNRPWCTATRFSPVALVGKMMSKEPTIIEIAMDELEEILRRAEAKQFNDKDYETTKTVFQSYVQLLDLLKSKNVSIGRLQKMLFGASTEKTAMVTGGGTDSEAGSSAARRAFHQAESGPTMTELHAWITRQFEDRLVEPNSSLGGASA